MKISYICISYCEESDENTNSEDVIYQEEIDDENLQSGENSNKIIENVEIIEKVLKHRYGRRFGNTVENLYAFI